MRSRCGPELWAQQKKCCPDCSCGDAAVALARRLSPLLHHDWTCSPACLRDHIGEAAEVVRLALAAARAEGRREGLEWAEKKCTSWMRLMEAYQDREIRLGGDGSKWEGWRLGAWQCVDDLREELKK